MLSIIELKDLLHVKHLHQKEKILLILFAENNAPKNVKKIKEIGSSAGLREINRWNISQILKSAKGFAIHTEKGWELNTQGKKYVEVNILKKEINKTSYNFYLLDINFQDILSDTEIAKILDIRKMEIGKNITSQAYLSSIIMMGSLIEGLLGYMIRQYPKMANQSKNAPKDKNGKIKPFSEWTLNDMIDVAYDVKWITGDIKKFSHSLREYRNLAHPYLQKDTKEFPYEDSCKICLSVVSAAINNIIQFIKKNPTI
ncbi:MAG: hypothetical protein AB1637_04275 [Elusimicrobiota bacterium]